MIVRTLSPLSLLLLMLFPPDWIFGSIKGPARHGSHTFSNTKKCQKNRFSDGCFAVWSWHSKPSSLEFEQPIFTTLVPNYINKFAQQDNKELLLLESGHANSHDQVSTRQVHYSIWIHNDGKHIYTYIVRWVVAKCMVNVCFFFVVAVEWIFVFGA
jgi:hypothetical protein